MKPCNHFNCRAGFGFLEMYLASSQHSLETYHTSKLRIICIWSCHQRRMQRQVGHQKEHLARSE